MNYGVLVVGGGGFIGSHVVTALQNAGYCVRVLDLVSSSKPAAGVDWITGPISDDTLVAAAVNGCDSVIFLANASLPGSSQASFESEAVHHVGATLRVAEISRSQGVGRFIFASSGGTVYGYDAPPDGLVEEGPTRPLNGYGVSKLSIERYLHLINNQGIMRTLSLRVSNPYGEGQRAHRAQGVVAAAMQHAMAGTVMPIWGDGCVERDFIHVEDVASAFVASLSYNGSSTVINIGSGKSRSIKSVLNAVRRHTGRDLVADYQPNRHIDVHRNVLNITQAKNELGWMPRVNFDKGLERTARWWREIA